MTATPDPARVAYRFSAAATSYDAVAQVQRRAAERLAECVPPYPAPHHMVDLGCGTGVLARALLRVWPETRLTGIDLAPGMVAACRETWPWHTFRCADLPTAPVPEDADAVVSSFALHWLADGPAVLRDWTAALPPGGRVAVAVPLPGSLGDLDAAYRRATGRVFPGLRYAPAAAYLDAVRAGGACVRYHETRSIAQACPSPMDALRTLRELGATARPESGDRPAGAGALRRALAAYAGPDGRAHLRFEVLILVGERVA